MTQVGSKVLNNIPINSHSMPVRTGRRSISSVKKNVRFIGLVHYDSFLTNKAVVNKDCI